MSQKYKPIKDLPQYSENPFIDSAIEAVDENTVTKRRFLKGNKGIEQQVISNQNGEITGHSAFLQYVEVDEDKFAKLYLSQFAAFWDLSKPAIRVFGYIITSCLIPNKDIFYVDKKEALEYTGYSSERYILTGLSVLCEHGIIARSNNSYKYFINPLVVFNGNRVTFAKTYVRKKTKTLKDDPNQMKLFPSDNTDLEVSKDFENE